MSETVELKKKFNLDKKQKIYAAIAGVVLLLFLCFLGMRINTVNVEGNDHVSQETIEQEVFGSSWWLKNPLVLAIHEKIGTHDTIPFVEKYTVSVSGISTANIIVYEKDITGYIEKLGYCMYFDKDGYIVESSMEVRSDIPKIVGMEVDTMVLGEQIPMEDSDLFQEILNISMYLKENTIQWGSRTKPLVEILDEVEVDTKNNVTCIFGKVKVYLGSRADMEEKLLEMSSILPELYGKEGTLYLNTYNSATPNPTYVFK